MADPPPPYETATPGVASDTPFVTRPDTQSPVKNSADLQRPKSAASRSEPQQKSHETVARHRLKKMAGEWDDKKMFIFCQWPGHCWTEQAPKLSNFSLARLQRSLLPRLSSRQNKVPRASLTLGAGEVVFKPHDGARWTSVWEWCLHWKLMENPSHPADSTWLMDITIVAKNPPWQPASGISFSDFHMSKLHGGMLRGCLPTTQDWYWLKYYAFTSLEALPQVERSWMAEVRIAHRDRLKLEALDWRSLLTAQNTAFFKIDQRVSPDEYKSVVLYQRHYACGNDITGQRVQPWDESTLEQLATFASSIMSLG